MTLLAPVASAGPASGRRRGVTILSGFLGSGKTTLLRAELRRSGPRSPAVVLNDFGHTPVDDVVLVEGGRAPITITGGCACCTRREELATALRELLDAEQRGIRPASDHVVIETSGLSDPGPIALTLADDPVLRHHYERHSTCVTVDALSGSSTLEHHEVARRQLLVADDLVVTKADLVAEDVVEELVLRLRALNPSARIAVAAGGELVREAASGERLSPRSGDEPAPSAGHLEQVRTLELLTTAPLEWHSFTAWLTLLLHRYGPQVLRVKGVLDVDGVGPVGVNGVQHVVHAPEHLTGTVPPGTRLVLILRGLDPDLVERSFLVLNRLDRSERSSP
jgi:G3E family GTPase